jgi:hypothetical protein
LELLLVAQLPEMAKGGLECLLDEIASVRFLTDQKACRRQESWLV